jgi:hypothetical protein
MNASLDSIYQLYFDTSPFSRIGPTTYAIAPSVGEGTIHRLSTYSGIEIVYSEYRLHSRQMNRFATRERMVELQFALSGCRSACVSGREFTLKRGQGALLLMQDFDVRFDIGCEEPIRSFALGIPVELFEYALPGPDRSGGRHFERLTKGCAFRQLDFVPDERGMKLANRLIEELEGRAMSPLLMEAAAYELLNLYLTQLFDPVPVCEGLSREDMRRVRRAAEFSRRRCGSRHRCSRWPSGSESTITSLRKDSRRYIVRPRSIICAKFGWSTPCSCCAAGTAM